jgi:hypothetical protein
MPAPSSDTAVLFQFFGKLPGETTAEFAAELAALTPDEKVELATMARAASPITLLKQDTAATEA